MLSDAQKVLDLKTMASGFNVI